MYMCPMSQFDGSLERLTKESDLLKNAYGHFFDLTIVNNDIEETIQILEDDINNLGNKPQWVSDTVCRSMSFVSYAICVQ